MKLTIDLRQDALMAHLTQYPERLATSVVRVMNRLTIMVQARVKEKLSGEVLHVQTGTLRRSINQEVRASGSAGMIEGIVGTNVEYAAAHEYGFDGTVSVRAHVRRISTAIKSQALQSATGKAATIARWVGRESKNQYVKGYADVAAHSMHMHVPERSFLRSALKEFEPVINIELQKALLEAFKP
jgi:phage gpG-like protein